MRSLRDFGSTRPAQAASHPSRPRQALVARQTKTSSIAAIALRGLAIAAIATGGALTIKYGVPVASLARAADQVAIKIGLGINQVSVSGSRNALSDDIFAALRLESSGSLLAYDTAAARARLEALPWVDTAQLIRVLPDGLDVTIGERKPYVVWQHKQLMFLVDAQGRTLEPTARAEHLDLPLVVGDDADASAHDLIDMLGRFPAIAGRLEAAVRVGGRRWDLRLKNAPTLMLPEGGPADALAAIERMDRDERVFERRLTAIDLRVAGRIAFEVTPLPAAKSAARPRITPDHGA